LEGEEMSLIVKQLIVQFMKMVLLPLAMDALDDSTAWANRKLKAFVNEGDKNA
jgi:hypothetical protein